MESIIDLHPPENLYCFDECTGIQALKRLTPNLPVAEEQPVFEDFDYKRNGTVVRSAIRFLYGNVLKDEDIYIAIPAQCTPRFLPEVLSVEEVMALINATTGFRNRMLLIRDHPGRRGVYPPFSFTCSPRNFMRIRHFGLFANRCKKKNIALCLKFLGTESKESGAARSVEEIMRSTGFYPPSLIAETDKILCRFLFSMPQDVFLRKRDGG